MRKCIPSSTEYKNIIGKNIQLARERKNWNQLALGKILGYSKGNISNIENGVTNLTVHSLHLFAEALNTDICTLTSLPTKQQNNENNMSIVNALSMDVANLKIQIKNLLPLAAAD